MTDDYTPEKVAGICEIPEQDLLTAVQWMANTPKMVSTVLQGFYQSVEATAAYSLVNSVHLILGAIGKPGAGPLLMAGQPSAMSNRETGAGGSYPGYRNPHNEVQMRDLCDKWNIAYNDFHPEVPKDILTMMEQAERGEIEFMWVMGTNPLVSLPNQNRSERILKRLFLVVQDPFIDTETVSTADIYLPASMWGEKQGCVTNADRSVNLLMQAVDPPGEARSDFDIFVEIAGRIGFKDKDGAPLISFKKPEDAFNEWRRVSAGRPCDYSGMTYDLLLEMGAIRWPCNEKYPKGCTRLSEDLHFWTEAERCQTYGVDFLTSRVTAKDEYIDPKGKAFLRPAAWRQPPNPVTTEYPYLLITGRVVYHFHTRTKTARSSVLNGHAPEPYIEIHPLDAEKMQISTGDLVEVLSPNGRWEGVAMVVDTVRPGDVFIPFHYGKGVHAANQHTWYARDAVSHQPHLKSSPVAVKRLSFGAPQGWLLERLEELNGHSIMPFAARQYEGTFNREI